MTEQEKYLARVRKAADRLADARRELVDSLTAAVNGGCSATVVGEAAGFTRQRVWQIVRSGLPGAPANPDAK